MSTESTPELSSDPRSDRDSNGNFPRTVANLNRRERKCANKARKEYTRPDGRVTQHELAIRKLLELSPDIQRNGFNLAVEKLWERIQREVKAVGGEDLDPLPEITFRPDAFLINEADKYLEIFEVEDWGPIRAPKREKMGWWWFQWDADDRHDWLPRLWLVNRHGMITTELPMSTLYMELIASGRLDTPPNSVEGNTE